MQPLSEEKDIGRSSHASVTCLGCRGWSLLALKAVFWGQQLLQHLLVLGRLHTAELSLTPLHHSKGIVMHCESGSFASQWLSGLKLIKSSDFFFLLVSGEPSCILSERAKIRVRGKIIHASNPNYLITRTFYKNCSKDRIRSRIWVVLDLPLASWN
jgi:hypothetical protein